MEELAQVYGRSLFQVALESGRLDELREQLGQFADALDEHRELAVFFFSPYFSSSEKEQSLATLLDGADEVFVNFLALLIENHRMPVIFRIRHEYERQGVEPPVEGRLADADDRPVAGTHLRADEPGTGRDAHPGADRAAAGGGGGDGAPDR